MTALEAALLDAKTAAARPFLPRQELDNAKNNLTAALAGFSPPKWGTYVPSGDTMLGVYNDATSSQLTSVTSLAGALAWLGSNARDNAAYTVLLGADESLSAITLDSASLNSKTGVTVTLKGKSTERTLRLSGSGALFTVDSGITLILEENITLRGVFNNSDSLVRVNNNGVFTMKAGSKITGNSISGNGGGVYVYYGTFTMDGGEISGNSASQEGGGVYVRYGTFTMNDGKISGNSGSGVHVSGGTFTMNDGEISGNSGSGVYVSYGTFTMYAGEISGNSGSGVHVSNGSSASFTMDGGEISGNSSSYNGGGVYVYSGTFTKTAGLIYGADDRVHGDTDEENTAVRGNGHALYVEDSNNSYPRRNGDIAAAQALSAGSVGELYAYTPGLSDPFWNE
jgi:hypothetical protein